MATKPIPSKSIAITSLDADTRELIKSAGQGTVRLIFEDDGKRVAAVVPMHSAQARDADRAEFFATFDRAAQRADLSEADAEKLALEAIKAMRSALT